MNLRQHGFTLIEVLVALAIFGVLTIVAYATLGAALANAEMLSERMDRLQAVQRAVNFLTNDLIQAAPRPVRLEIGESAAPPVLTSVSGDFALEVTHGGWPNPSALPRSTQQRSAYRIEDGSLVRYYWNVLDRTFANEPFVTVVLDRVQSLAFRYYLDSGEWTEVWPPQQGLDAEVSRVRPRAVEIVLTLEDEGEITRLVEVSP